MITVGKWATSKVRGSCPAVSTRTETTVHLGYNAVDTFQPEPAKMIGVDVEGQISYAPNEAGEVQVDGMITEYPSAEIYQYGPDSTPASGRFRCSIWRSREVSTCPPVSNTRRAICARVCSWS